MKRENKPYTKLTANIPIADMGFIDKLVKEGKFASRTDVTREAFRRLKRGLKESPSLSSSEPSEARA